MNKGISAKVRAVLAIAGKKNVEFAEYLGIMPQSLQNKYVRGSWSAADLIRLADFVGAELSLQLGEDKVVFDSSCIIDKEAPER